MLLVDILLLTSGTFEGLDSNSREIILIDDDEVDLESSESEADRSAKVRIL